MLNNQSVSKLKTIVANEEMILLSDKAIHMPYHDMLLVSDLHFGKIEHFRKNGIGLPPQAARKDIHKLDRLISNVEAGRIIFLGDLFHSDYNNAWVEFQEMIETHKKKEFHLILGNHDVLEENLYKGMKVDYSMEINDLLLTHEPLDVDVAGKYNLCGHIHPGVKLKGKGKQSLRLPCFYFGEKTGIIPAFGTFTGTHVLKPFPGDRVYVVKDDIVIQVD